MENKTNASNDEFFAKAGTQTNERKGLISRMLSKSKEHKASKTKSSGLKKKIGAVALAGALALGTAGLAGCNNIFNPDNPNPSIDLDPITPEPDSTYSEILTTINESSYYSNISERYLSGEAIGAEFHLLPYGYLEEHYDIDATTLVENTMQYTSNAYIKGNNTNHLYVSSKISVDDAPDPYYIFTTLMYEISDKEYEEFRILNEEEAIQSGYYIQELSKQREPAEEHSIKVTQDVIDSFYKLLKNSDTYTMDVWGHDNIEMDWLDASVSNQTINIAVRGLTAKETGFVRSGEIRYMEMVPAIGQDVSTEGYDNTIFNGPRNARAENFDDYVNSVEDITYFIAPTDRTAYRVVDIDNVMKNNNLTK